jgi:hypothetical protein
MSNNQANMSLMAAKPGQPGEAYILSAPNEMLDNIMNFAFTHLLPQAGQPAQSKHATMLATSTVCKRFYALTIRHLYRRAKFLIQANESNLPVTATSLYRFYRSLRENPNLWLLCQDFELYLHNRNHSTFSEREEELALIAKRLLQGLPNLKKFWLTVQGEDCLAPGSPELLLLQTAKSPTSLEISGFGQEIIPSMQSVREIIYSHNLEPESLYLEFVVSRGTFVPGKVRWRSYLTELRLILCSMLNTIKWQF